MSSVAAEPLSSGTGTATAGETQGGSAASGGGGGGNNSRASSSRTGTTKNNGGGRNNNKSNVTSGTSSQEQDGGVGGGDAAEKQPCSPTLQLGGGGGGGGGGERGGGESSASNTTTNTENKQQQDSLLRSISSKQNVLMQPTITLTMYIPTASVGAVIGRRGQNIANLQKMASQAASTKHPVRVSVIGEDSSGNTESLPYTYSELDFSDAKNWTPVVVRADVRATFVAAKKLEETVNGVVDEVVLDVPINRNKHAAIVGKRGLTLANMSADTNVRIMVPNKDLPQDIIQLEGDLANVKKCLDRVLQIASSAKGSGGGGPVATSAGGGTASKGKPSSNKQQQSAGDTTSAAPERTSQSITVNQLPSQTKLRSIGRKTDTNIKKRRVDDSVQITVSGTSQEQVQNAISILQKWNDNLNNEKDNNNATSSGTRQAGEGDGGSPTQQQQSSSQPPTRRGRNKRYNIKGTPKRGGGKSSKANSGGVGGTAGGGGGNAPSSS